MSHTPAPWTLIRDPEPDDGPGCFYYLDGPETDYDGGFLAADARLIAAAPELLEALKVMLKSARPHPVEHPSMTRAWRLAESVVAKAEGST